MEDQKPIPVKMEHTINVAPDSFLFGEEPAVAPPRSGIDRMKRADLIAELRREQMRMQSMVKHKDELKATLLRCNKLLTDTRRASQEREREHQLTTWQNQELIRGRDARLQRLQQEVAQSRALRQQVLDQLLTKDFIVENILQENAAQEAHLQSQIGELTDQRDAFHGKMHEAEELLEKIYDENNCSVCLSPWEAEGAHRMVSLKCGHLFGDSCIRQHLRRVQDCPYCKMPVQNCDIRYIFGCRVLRAAPSAQAVPVPQEPRQAQTVTLLQVVNQAQAAFQPQAAPQFQAIHQAWAAASYPQAYHYQYHQHQYYPYEYCNHP